MNSDNRLKILDILSKNSPLRPIEIQKSLGISSQAMYRHLKKLVQENKIKKKGEPPLVFYELVKNEKKVNFSFLNKEEEEIIEKNFSFLSPKGELLQGKKAFSAWLIKTSQEKSAQTLVLSYLKQHKEIYSNKDNFFDLTDKIKKTFKAVYVKKIICSDFYSLPQFGKTHMGNLVTAGKSGQYKPAIKEIVSITKSKIIDFIKKEKIDSIAWVPHSIQRNLLFLPTIREMLNLDLQEIQLVKVYSGNIPVAQKSLSKLKERIENARETILIKSKPSNIKKVLIIDDALGSGATVNESAKIIQDQLNVKEIYAYAFVGSYKGFDVLSVI